MRRHLAALAALFTLLTAGTALAGTCAGFTDVADTDPFCADVTWIKNRGITLGCQDGTKYCPNDAVLRVQMAAFLHRMGNVTFQQGGNAFGVAGHLGTSDNQPVEIYANAQRALRLQPGAAAPNVIAGFAVNSAAASVSGATIAGGGTAGAQNATIATDRGPVNCPRLFGCTNAITDSWGTVGGGAGNQAGDGSGTATDRPFATVAGGLGNGAIGFASNVGGGQENLALGLWSVVGGGVGNTSTVAASTVAGGLGNAAAEDSSTVGGGNNNAATGRYATVPGGANNQAQGFASFAAGSGSIATGDGSFVWSDELAFGFNPSAAPYGWANPANTFNVRATGGVWFVTAAAGADAHPTAGVEVLPGAGAWQTYSDRNGKDNFASIDPVAVLESVASMPVSTWNWKSENAAIRHMGPMAQDFRAAFGLGADDRHITTVDIEGVALAAIQGLHRLMQEKDARLEAQQRELQSLRDEFEALKAMLGQR